jgi:hypothetical protein
MQRIHCQSSVGTSFTSNMVDALLEDLANQSSWASEKIVNIQAPSGYTASTEAAAAITTLEANSVTVTVN